ncbi:hypothetical protein Droror1_Dr00002039 [Drosera rotundifolia]
MSHHHVWTSHWSNNPGSRHRNDLNRHHHKSPKTSLSPRPFTFHIPAIPEREREKGVGSGGGSSGGEGERGGEADDDAEEESDSGFQHQEAPLLLRQSRQAITTVVTIAEILKNNGFLWRRVGMKDETRGRMVPKAKIEIVLEKTEKFDSLMSANNRPKAAAADATIPDDKKEEGKQ